jgi:hypothetical protein
MQCGINKEYSLSPPHLQLREIINGTREGEAKENGPHPRQDEIAIDKTFEHALELNAGE